MKQRYLFQMFKSMYTLPIQQVVVNLRISFNLVWIEV